MKKIKFIALIVAILISTSSVFAQSITITHNGSSSSYWWPLTVSATYVRNVAPFTNTSQTLTFTTLNTPQALNIPFLNSLYYLHFTLPNGATAGFSASELSGAGQVSEVFSSPAETCAVFLTKDGNGNFSVVTDCTVGIGG